MNQLLGKQYIMREGGGNRLSSAAAVEIGTVRVKTYASHIEPEQH